VTRSEAYLDSSLSTAMTYHFTQASLTAQYMHDEALTEEDVTDSFQFSLLIVSRQSLVTHADAGRFEERPTR
jgi:hypothetical protein